MDQATMFLCDVSVVDHAYIDNRGLVIGGSFHPSFLVSGNIDPEEKVVVDFSTIKKQLKKEIDDDAVGFDHKCWIIEGYSDIVSMAIDGKEVTFAELNAPDDGNGIYWDETINIITSACSFVAPRSAFKFIQTQHMVNPVYSTEHAGQFMEEYLNKYFNQYGITVKCKNSERVHHYRTGVAMSTFRYTHGLKDSTSWGCQNLAHGHYSFIELNAYFEEEEDQSLTQSIADHLDNAVFINRENIVNECDKFIEIEYTSERGHFWAQYCKGANKIIVLDTETTVEYLIEYVATEFKEDLNRLCISELFVSEGLSKGAYMSFDIHQPNQ